MGLTEQQRLDSTYVMQTYARKPVEFVEGHGMMLIDDTGKEYLDFIAGVGAVSMGHSHPAVTQAIQEQAARLVHVSNYYHVPGRGELARTLSELLNRGNADSAPGTWRTFFANSGAEANEGAIKLARRYGSVHNGGATTIVSAKRSFHGRTLATLTATGQPAKQEAFRPLPPGFTHVELNDRGALLDALDKPTEGAVCAVMLECIQGEGGVWPCTREYLQAVRTLTAERNILLILDEVQTGFYRCGTHPFAFQHYDITPDIVTLAKGIGNGIPMGALCAQDRIAASFQPGDHGSTFGGGPLACAAANATIKAMEDENIGEHVEQVGSYLRERLSELEVVAEVRGRGLMVGVQLVRPVASQIVATALDNGLLLNNIGADIIRFLPPLVCYCEEVDTLVQRLKSVTVTL